MTKGKTAVVVLSYNGLATTQRFFDEFEKNTDLSQVKIYWIDNNSKDETPEYLRKKAEELDCLSLNFQDTNTGVIGGRNIGFEWFFNEAKDCDKILFIDNDQYVREGWLDHHISVLNKGLDIVGVEAWQMSDTFLPVRKNVSLREWFTYVGCGGMLIRRECAEEIGLFDTRFNPSYFEDPDYVFRAREKKFSVGWNFKARIIHVPHQTLGQGGDAGIQFVKSLNMFRGKWKGHPIPKMMQSKIPEFEE